MLKIKKIPQGVKLNSKALKTYNYIHIFIGTCIYPYPIGKSRPCVSKYSGSNNIVIDRRSKKGFLIRQLTPIECERLFTYEDNYTARMELIGNSFVVKVIEYILTGLHNL